MQATERPWMTALEMQFTALRTGLKSVAITRTDETLARVEREVVKVLPGSQPYAWSKDTTMAVWAASQSVPLDSRFSFDLLPFDALACWWWFDWPLPIRQDALNDAAADGLIDAKSISALLLFRLEEGPHVGQRGLFVGDFRMTPYGPMLSSFFVVPENSTLGDVLDGRSFDPADESDDGEPTTPRVASLGRFILGACAWIKQRIIITASGHVERHRRKQIARDHSAVVGDVKVIELRRPESASHVEIGGSQVEWSCRWIVTGHWRNQPYKDGRQLIYIMPHVKGPTDMPLKVPTHTVYSVER